MQYKLIIPEKQSKINNNFKSQVFGRRDTTESLVGTLLVILKLEFY